MLTLNNLLIADRLPLMPLVFLGLKGSVPLSGATREDQSRVRIVSRIDPRRLSTAAAEFTQIPVTAMELSETMGIVKTEVLPCQAAEDNDPVTAISVTGSRMTTKWMSCWIWWIGWISLQS